MAIKCFHVTRVRTGDTFTENGNPEELIGHTVSVAMDHPAYGVVTLHMADGSCVQVDRRFVVEVER